MEFKDESISFSSKTGKATYEPKSPKVITFSKSVTQAAVILRGFTCGFSPGDDHHLGKVEIGFVYTHSGNSVSVQAILGVRDWSEDWDDPYEGKVDFTVLAEI